MIQDEKRVSIAILDKEYQIGCPTEKEQDLVASASYLDEKMREIRDSGRVVGMDKVAVMAALNIAHELLSMKDVKDQSSKNVDNYLQVLHDKAEAAIARNSFKLDQAGSV